MMANVIATKWEQVNKDDLYKVHKKPYRYNNSSLYEAVDFIESNSLFVGYMAPAEMFLIYPRVKADMVYIDCCGNILVYTNSSCCITTSPWTFLHERDGD